MPTLSRRDLLLLAPVLLPVFARGQPADPTFSSDVKVVNLLASVRNKNHGIVADLNQHEFVLREDGHLQTILYFARESELPLTIGLMIDTSMSQERVLNAERGACFRFVDAVLREGKDQFFIMQFDMTVKTSLALTGSRQAIDDALKFVDTPTRKELRAQSGGGTLLFDALVYASQQVLKKRTGRKAMILLSDGGENGSDVNRDAAIDEAVRAETAIYSILFSDEGYGSGDRRTMQGLAEGSGGMFFEISKKLTIEVVFRMIEMDLRSQYSLGYVPDRPVERSEFRKIELTTTRQGLTVQSRDRYWAYK